MNVIIRCMPLNQGVSRRDTVAGRVAWSDQGKNADYACDFIHREFDGVEVTKPEEHVYALYRLFGVLEKTQSDAGAARKTRLGSAWLGKTARCSSACEGCIRINCRTRLVKKYVFVDTATIRLGGISTWQRVLKFKQNRLQAIGPYSQGVAYYTGETRLSSLDSCQMRSWNRGLGSDIVAKPQSLKNIQYDF